MFLLNPPFIWRILGFSLATSWNHFPALITGHPGSPIKSQVVGCCGLHHYPSAHGIIDRQRPQAMQKNLEKKEFGNGKLTNLGWGNTLGILRWGSTDFNSGFPRLKRDQCEKMCPDQHQIWGVHFSGRNHWTEPQNAFHIHKQTHLATVVAGCLKVPMNQFNGLETNDVKLLIAGGQ